MVRSKASYFHRLGDQIIMLITQERVEKLITMGCILVSEHPTDARLKAMVLSLKEVKSEISKPDVDRGKINHMAYGVTRVFTDILDFENTLFGEELGNFLVDLNVYIDNLI
jgi:hypothetical protein